MYTVCSYYTHVYCIAGATNLNFRNLCRFNFGTRTRCIKIRYYLLKLLVNTCTLADTTTGARFTDSTSTRRSDRYSPDLECSYFSALAAYLVSLRSA